MAMTWSYLIPTCNPRSLLNRVRVIQRSNQGYCWGLRYTPLLHASSLRDSGFDIPKYEIPAHRLEYLYSRSSGPGGQNVNKLNTKVEVRFHVDSADWIPHDVKQRLKSLFPNRVNSAGEFYLTSQEGRTQKQNKESCIQKLKDFLDEAFVEPKVREMWQGMSEKGKERKQHDKKHNSAKKAARSAAKNFKDYD